MLVGLVLAVCVWALPAAAHIALWDEAMFGWDPNDPNQSEPILPLMHLNFDQWWFHGYINKPPASGKFMTLPAGGTYHGQVACNKALTSYGQNDYQQTGIYACDGGDTSNGGIGAMHTKDEWESPNPTDVKGCGISIAYVSDEHAVQPEDFTVISTNYTCPWFKHVDFQIPSDLPACPPEGCLCSWGWIHSINGGSQQNYHLVYRCKVDGATGVTPIPKAKTANMCNMPEDTSNCTVGAKQPHYWYQNERNNNPQGEYNPPFYNNEYGFTNGAQTDLFATVGGSQKGEAPVSSSAASSSMSNTPITESSSTGMSTSSSGSPQSTSQEVSSFQSITTSNSPVNAPSSITSAPATTTSSGTKAGTCRRRKRAFDRLATVPELLQKHRIRSVKRAERHHGRERAARGDHLAEIAKKAREWEDSRAKRGLGTESLGRGVY